MGYRSNFLIKTKIPKEKLYEHIRYNLYSTSDTDFDFSIYDAKWYECDSDMIQLSKEYPDELIIVRRYGEEIDDIEHMFFKNGKIESIKYMIKIPETKLK